MIVLKTMARFFASVCSLLPYAYLNAHTISKHNVGVFCATDEAIPDFYKNQASELGKSLERAGYGLTTGGGNTGLMSAVINGFVFEGNAINTRAVIPSVFKDYDVHHLEIPEANLV